MKKDDNLNFNNSRREASLMLIKRCPVCNSNYFPEKLEILEEQGNTFLAHLSCNNCGSNLIIRVVASPHGLIGTATLTDLLAEEVLNFNESEVISANDILDLIDLINQSNFLNNLILE